MQLLRYWHWWFVRSKWTLLSQVTSPGFLLLSLLLYKLLLLLFTTLTRSFDGIIPECSTFLIAVVVIIVFVVVFVIILLLRRRRRRLGWCWAPDVSWIGSWSPRCWKVSSIPPHWRTERIVTRLNKDEKAERFNTSTTRQSILWDRIRYRVQKCWKTTRLAVAITAVLSFRHLIRNCPIS